MKKRIVSLGLIMIMALTVITGCKNAEYREAEAAFQKASSQLEDNNALLDTELDNARALVASPDKALDETLRTALETAISNAKTYRVEVTEIPKELEDIKSQTAVMQKADYSVALNELKEAYDALDKSMKQYALVNNPSESYIIQ